MKTNQTLKIGCVGVFALALLSACGEFATPVQSRLTLQSSVQNGALQIQGLDSFQGKLLASSAESGVSGGTGYCYQYVAQAIHSQYTPFLSGMHAYLAAEQLASNPLFKEVQVAPALLPALPAGAVVVWGQGSSESGHISIADGRGQEISDHIAPQMTAHYGGAQARVFVPVLP